MSLNVMSWWGDLSWYYYTGVRFWGYSSHIKQRIQIHLRGYPEAWYREKVGTKSRAVFISFSKLVWECLGNICRGENTEVNDDKLRCKRKWLMGVRSGWQVSQDQQKNGLCSGSRQMWLETLRRQRGQRRGLSRTDLESLFPREQL